MSAERAGNFRGKEALDSGPAAKPTSMGLSGAASARGKAGIQVPKLKGSSTCLLILGTYIVPVFTGVEVDANPHTPCLSIQIRRVRK